MERFTGPPARVFLRNAELWGGCPTGEARITGGYDLPARYIIHTVGPVWHGGSKGEEAQLANCYRNSLSLALEKGLKTIAFPSISTGAYRFPIEKAVRIAVREVREFLTAHPDMKVFFVCFSEKDLNQYRQALREPGGE